MRLTISQLLISSLLGLLTLSGIAWCGPPLDGTAPLNMAGDLAEKMVRGIHLDLDKRIIAARVQRAVRWKNEAADAVFVAERRAELAVILGAVDERLPVTMETVGQPGKNGPIAQGSGYAVYPVRWPVFDGVFGEGYLLEPTGEATASLVVLPDADEEPELVLGLGGATSPRSNALHQFAAEGCRIVVLSLVNRADTWSGNPKIRMTNQPHREYIYRGAFQMGRHIVGYEVQSTRAALDWLTQEGPGLPVGIMGYGEGGLIALSTSALDTRVAATVVSGYFGAREGLWEEPIYRNIWALQKDFGDAELTAMIAPRTLLIENATPPDITGPPMAAGRSHGAAPGVIPAPSSAEVQKELDRATAYHPAAEGQPWLRRTGTDGGLPGQADTMSALVKALGIPTPKDTAPVLKNIRELPDRGARMKRQVEGWLAHTDRVAEDAPFARKALWKKADDTSVATWVDSTRPLRKQFHEEVIGKLPESDVPLHPRTRQVYDTDAYIGYEVVLDVYADVFAYGILLVPKGIPAGERRPVVVCQHGLEGRPQEVADPNYKDTTIYEQFGCRLAERGFVVYAPQNLYIGGDYFRTVQRKANPLGLSLFSYIIAHHAQALNWLGNLPFVDKERIAFYGLSYGGKTAVTVPAILEGYCLSISSGNFNEWVWKTLSRDHGLSYMLHGEYEMFEWNLGNTFNHAEMSWLICPRPFMVERGHWDGVAPDEWVGYEYARTRNRYDLLGIGDDTTIEYFNGPHKIHGVGTFAFLHEKLNFPAPAQP